MKCVLREVFNNSRNALYCLANQESQTRRLDESPKLSETLRSPVKAQLHGIYVRIQTSSQWIFENSPATRQTGESYLINSEFLGIQEIFCKQLTDRTSVQ